MISSSAYHNEGWLHPGVEEWFARQSWKITWLISVALKCGQLQCCWKAHWNRQRKRTSHCQSFNLQSSFSRCPFSSSQRGLSCQPDVSDAGVAPTTRHRAPRRPVIQRPVPPVSQQWAPCLSAVWRQCGIRSRQAGVKGNKGGDQQAAGPHILHLRNTGLF